MKLRHLTPSYWLAPRTAHKLAEGWFDEERNLLLPGAVKKENSSEAHRQNIAAALIKLSQTMPSISRGSTDELYPILRRVGAYPGQRLSMSYLSPLIQIGDHAGTVRELFAANNHPNADAITCYRYARVQRSSSDTTRPGCVMQEHEWFIVGQVRPGEVVGLFPLAQAALAAIEITPDPEWLGKRTLTADLGRGLMPKIFDLVVADIKLG